MSKLRIVSGMRPSGKLHIGHLKGVLLNWLKLQEEYDSFFFAADWHALTTEYTNTTEIKSSIFDMICDWLSVGIDPSKSTIFIQSHVKQHSELYLLLSMITPLGWLERCPTYKETLLNSEHPKDISTHGFLGYPVLQAADIMLYKANAVPVGEDQLPHLELSREIIRRFHFIYKTDMFPEPVSKLSKYPKLLGTDGRKMSKTYNNSIYITDTESVIKSKVAKMVTDPKRIHVSDKGNPDICSVFSMYKVFDEKNLKNISSQCKNAEIGCVECKKKITTALIETLKPLKDKRMQLEKNSSYIWDIVWDGSKKATKIAEETLKEVREVIKFDY